MARKLTPGNIVKGFRYLKHFGLKEFLVKLEERMEPDEVPYGPWYESYKPTQQELEAQRKKSWKDPVIFDLAVPVYRTPEVYLRAMIDSCIAQTYPHWNLYIANADPADEGVRQVLADYASDSRIHVIDLTDNIGIAENTNPAIEAGNGDWIGLVDHDDELSPAALWKIASYLEKHPETEMVYTDEDKITGDGSEHMDPALKPDFNPDLLCQNNYICHFLTVKRSLVEEAGMLDGAYNGAQDFDFIFRCCEKAKAVGHVPEILYHWRTHAASTSDNPMSKMYAYEAGKAAIEAHLERTGLHAQVSLRKDLGFYDVRWKRGSDPLVSIIIPNKDEKDTLAKCLRSIEQKSTYRNYEILVVENNSTDQGTFEYYKEIDGKNKVKVLYWDKPFNYSAINNFGVSHAKGEYLVFLNNDIEVITPDWMEEMLGLCERQSTGIVGAKLYYPDDTVQHAGIVIGIGGVAGSIFVGLKRAFSGYMHKANLLQDLSAVTAACMMMKKSVFDEIGGFEEKLAVAFNDVDLCLRSDEAGYLTVFDPHVEMYHYESKTRGAEDTKEKVARFQSEIEYMRTRWTSLLIDGDPCYNKNLSLKKWNYSLRSGERMR